MKIFRRLPSLKKRISQWFLVPGLLCSVIFSGCGEKQSADTNDPLFKLLQPEQTHIDFANTLTEGLNTNVLMYEYFYNGGGVATGDLNGDGLPDVYFTGNMTDNKLYLNQGKMQFKDITAEAGVAGRPGPWKTGITMADVNGDGKLDLYVCYSGKVRAEKRINQLFINREMMQMVSQFLKIKLQIMVWIFLRSAHKLTFLIMTEMAISTCCL